MVRGIVDSKSTVVLARFLFLLGDVLFDHRIRDGARGHGELPAGPQVPAPELLAEVSELLEEHADDHPFGPLHEHTDVLVRPVGH